MIVKYYVMEKEDDEWRQLAFFEPEPLFKTIVKERTGDESFLKCPAVQDYFKNAFLIRCPVDVTINVSDDGNLFNVEQYDQKFFDNNITIKSNSNSKHNMIGIGFNYVFIAENDLMLELLPASMHSTSQSLKEARVVSGTFDISKWVRPVEFAFEVDKSVKRLVFKRGDPLFYVRLVTKESVKLERIEQDEAIQKVAKGCVFLKSFLPKNKMEDNYALFSSMASKLKRKLFKK